jgi:ketosteroid isomerase-like protein
VAVPRKQQIRTLITDWAAAVHRRQTDRVLATTPTTSPCSTYRRRTTASAASRPTETPGRAFFEWQAGGASFEIVSWDVAAEADVAYACVLLRCGMP